MADSISNVHIKAFTDIVLMKAQQMMTKAKPWVEVKNVTGESASFQTIGSIEMVAKPSRHAPTPSNDPNHQSRWCTLAAYHAAIQLDDTDVAAILMDPMSKYGTLMAAAIARKWDTMILSAAVANAAYGVSGASTETWSSYTDRNSNSHVIGVGGGPLSVSKVLQAGRLLDECEVDEGPENRVLFVSPQAVEDMLATVETTSRDYGPVYNLYNKSVQQGFGFTWVMSNRLPKSSTTRKCIAMQKGAVGLAYGILGNELKHGIRTDLSYAREVYGEMMGGSVRLDGERVVEIDVTES